MTKETRMECWAKKGKKWEMTYETTSEVEVWERLARDMMWRYLAKANYAKRITETAYGNIRTITVYDVSLGYPFKRIYTLPN